MISSHDRQAALEKAVRDEAEMEIDIIRKHTGAEPKIIPGTSFIDDRVPITRGRRK